jgi:hypothetical protein
LCHPHNKRRLLPSHANVGIRGQINQTFHLSFHAQFLSCMVPVPWFVSIQQRLQLFLSFLDLGHAMTLFHGNNNRMHR